MFEALDPKELIRYFSGPSSALFLCLNWSGASNFSQYVGLSRQRSVGGKVAGRGVSFQQLLASSPQQRNVRLCGKYEMY